MTPKPPTHKAPESYLPNHLTPEKLSRLLDQLLPNETLQMRKVDGMVEVSVKTTGKSSSKVRFTHQHIFRSLSPLPVKNNWMGVEDIPTEKQDSEHRTRAKAASKIVKKIADEKTLLCAQLTMALIFFNPEKATRVQTRGGELFYHVQTMGYDVLVRENGTPVRFKLESDKEYKDV